MENFESFLEKSILIISGIHGDERAPIEAMNVFIKKYKKINNVTLIPVANPSAFLKGDRKGNDNKDFNRQFCSKNNLLIQKFKNIIDDHQILITLHEWDGEGVFAFYSDSEIELLASKLVNMGKKEFGIAVPNEEKHLSNMKNGLVLDTNNEKYKCTMETYAIKSGKKCITTETPVGEDFAKTVKVNLEFIQALVFG